MLMHIYKYLPQDYQIWRDFKIVNTLNGGAEIFWSVNNKQNNYGEAVGWTDLSFFT